MTAITNLMKGQNGPLTVGDVVIWVQIAAPADLSALLVTDSGKVRSDADFVFFNQPSGPGVNLQPGAPGQLASLRVSPAAVPADIAQIRAVITLDGAGSSFGAIPAPIAYVSDAAGNPLYAYRIDGLSSESIVIALELYRRMGDWKVRAVGQGYAGGFAALVTDHGVRVDDEVTSAPQPQFQPPPPPPQQFQPAMPPPQQYRSPPPQYQSPPPPPQQFPSAPPQQYQPVPPPPQYQSSPPQQFQSAPPPFQPPPPPSQGFQQPPPFPPSAQQPQVRSVPGEEKLSLEKRQTLNMRKQEVAKVLLTKGANGIGARVVLVIDKTGSMSREYASGVVHRVVERMVPVATQLDDDGQLESYLYGKSFAKLPNVTVADAEAWCETFIHMSGKHGGINYGKIGGVNDELPIMTEVLKSLRPGDAPTLVLFFTDGGFSKRTQIAALMRDASRYPVFWQFIGLGHSGFGILHELDTLDGRVVDNAGFFAVGDIDRMTDAQLYAQLLNEFPDWLRAARAANILR
ncbi:vWA domain-containing protein [Nocardia sp. NBC_01388]|uniref:vWA domain-containing protein n=1 Tax=Nocardia sp. NBC_01388 TaxID=2903596 RepID=UPI003251088C